MHTLKFASGVERESKVRSLIIKTDFHVEFKIRFAKDKPEWAKAMIFQDKETMYRFFQMQMEKTGEKEPNNFLAMWQPFKIIKIDKKGNEKTSHRRGNLLLFKDKLGVGLIAHECGHGAFDYWRELHPREQGEQASSIHDMKQEDEFLHILGYLVKEFWAGYFKHEKEIQALGVSDNGGKAT